MKKSLMLLFVLLSASVFAGPEDSLRLKVKTARTDSAKCQAYYELGNSLRSSPAKAMDVVSEMVNFCEGIESKKDKALCYRRIGVLFHYLQHFDKALDYYYRSVELCDELNDKKGQAACYNNIANAFQNKGMISSDPTQFSSAIEYHEKCMKLLREMKDTSQLKNSFNNIALVYMSLNEFDKAIDYLNDAQEYYKTVTKNKHGIDMTTINLGDAYLGKALLTRKPEYFRKALWYFTDRLNAYKIGTEKENLAAVLERMGKVYLETEQLPRALESAEKSHALFAEIEDHMGLSTSAMLLADIYEAKNDFKSANKYLRLHIDRKDSTINQTSRINAEQMQIMYESTRKDKEIETLSHEKEIQDIEINRHRNFLMTAMAILALILLLAFVLFSRYNLKKKANLKLSKAYHHIEQKNRQITDSINYAKRIQSAILPPLELLNREFRNFFICYQPKDIVSGDFYWFHRHNKARFFVIGDCTGHGVPGALMSMIGNTLLNEIILQKNITEPGRILEQLHNGVVSALRQQGYDSASQDDGMDVTVCVLKDEQANVLQYATANHCLFVKTGNDVKELSGDIYSIGGGYDSADRKFVTQTEILTAGDFVILSSDGYYDQFGGEKNSKFLISRFEKLIKNLDLTAPDSSEKFKAAIEKWRGEVKQTDDILVAGFAV